MCFRSKAESRTVVASGPIDRFTAPHHYNFYLFLPFLLFRFVPLLPSILMLSHPLLPLSWILVKDIVGSCASRRAVQCAARRAQLGYHKNIFP